MGTASAIQGIDPASWKVTLLPLPKRFSRGNATGFCGGHPVGQAETARAAVAACWWPEGAPSLLEFEGLKSLATGRAGGELIPGHCRRKPSSEMTAVAWRLQGGSLSARHLHPAEYQRSWGAAAGGGLVVGVGVPQGKVGQRAPNVGLVWRDDAPPVVLGGEGDVLLLATDGVGVAGNIHGHAAWWPSVTGAPVMLAPEGMFMSEAHALDGATQAGHVFKGMRARAALWRGTAASFVDLTPAGFETGRIHAAAGGFQAGMVREKDHMKNGTPGSDDRAALWQGAADRWMDLNALLPADKYNASTAWGMEIHDGELRICGEASRYEVSDPGTPRESHFVPVAHPVLWTARLA